MLSIHMNAHQKDPLKIFDNNTVMNFAPMLEKTYRREKLSCLLWQGSLCKLVVDKDDVVLAIINSNG